MSATLDLSGIEVFIQVVKAGSFTAAGDRLGLPKSTISRRVTRLEQELGARLLHRTTRQLRLTEVGSEFFDRVSKAVDDLEDAARSVSDDQEVPRGVIRITAPVDFGFSYLGDIVASFRKLYPEVEVDVDITQRTINLVEEGFDLALRAGKLADSSLVATKLADTDFGLFASPAYLAARGTPKELADLAEHDCLLFRGRPGRRRWNLEGPSGRETVDVVGHVSANDFSFLHGMLLADAGITQLPRFVVKCDVHAGRLAEVLPQYKNTDGALYLVYPSSRHLSAKVRAFRDHVLKELEDQPWAMKRAPKRPPREKPPQPGRASAAR
ncbi:MAG: LysR family transcriptional regulator [Polyangiaceae bacterium]